MIIIHRPKEQLIDPPEYEDELVRCIECKNCFEDEINGCVVGFCTVFKEFLKDYELEEEDYCDDFEGRYYGDC